MIALATALLLAATPAQGAKPEPLVDLGAYVPDLVLDLRYATDDNFMKKAVYPKGARCLLRRSVAERLKRVADRLRAEDGTRLLVYDCYRPRRVQEEMWKIFPQRGYVAPPRPGSVHNRGAAVDLGLADRDGKPLPMPSDFDTFDETAWQRYEGGTAEQRRNRDRLRAAMQAEGFRIIRKEWWHYEAPGAKRHEVLDEPFEKWIPDAGK